MNKQVRLTKVGLSSLKKEYEELVNVKRPRLVARLSYAREQGDLSENVEYHAAKEELDFLDGRIAELKEVLQNASIIASPRKTNGSVAVGTKVTVKVNGGKQVFDIVGEWEADPVNRKISHESPLGQALVGKKVGEKVEVEAPAGKLTYQVLAIE